jgi:DNA-binding FadR family transcriptional regulator
MLDYTVMKVSQISSTNPHPAIAQGGFLQMARDFKAIGSTLQSGDLAAAQNAVLKFQQDLAKSPETDSLNKLFGPTGSLGNDFQALQIAIQSNDPASAQQAFTVVVQGFEKLIAANR